MAHHPAPAPPTISTHIYEVRPRKDHRGVDLISDALPFWPPLGWRAKRNQQCNRIRLANNPQLYISGTLTSYELLCIQRLLAGALSEAAEGGVPREPTYG